MKKSVIFAIIGIVVVLALGCAVIFLGKFNVNLDKVAFKEFVVSGDEINGNIGYADDSKCYFDYWCDEDLENEALHIHLKEYSPLNFAIEKAENMSFHYEEGYNTFHKIYINSGKNAKLMWTYSGD